VTFLTLSQIGSRRGHSREAGYALLAYAGESSPSPWRPVPA